MYFFFQNETNRNMANPLCGIQTLLKAIKEIAQNDFFSNDLNLIACIFIPQLCNNKTIIKKNITGIEFFF